MCLVIIVIFEIKDSCSKLIHISSPTFSLLPLNLLLPLLQVLRVQLLVGHCYRLTTAAAPCGYSAAAAGSRCCCFRLSMR
jgi:hypothetical protein